MASEEASSRVGSSVEERRAVRRWALEEMNARVRAGTWSYPAVAGLLAVIGGSDVPLPSRLGPPLVVLALVLSRERLKKSFADRYGHDPAAWRRRFFGHLLAIVGVLGVQSAIVGGAVESADRVLLVLLVDAVLTLGVLSTFAAELGVVLGAVAIVGLPLAAALAARGFEDRGGFVELAAVAVFLVYLWLSASRAHRSSRQALATRFVAESRKTELEEAQAALEASNAELVRLIEERTRNYRTVFRDAQEAILILDPEDETVLDANPTAAVAYGLSVEDLIGRSMREFSVESVDRVEQVREAGSIQFETRQRRADGRELEFEVHASLVEFEGRTAVLSLNRDLSGRRRAERLRAEVEAAEAANRAKSLFLANMSHEMRTPLTAILGTADLMLATPDIAPGHRSSVERIERAGRSLLRLIDDILDLARIEEGRVELDHRAVDVAELARGVEETVLPRLAGRAVDVRIEVRIEEGAPERIWSDPVKLEQVLLNLVGNAIKFTELGSVVLSVGRAAEGRALRFEVRDTGSGIEPRELERIFTDFTRSRRAITDHVPGTGLGLAIASRLVRLLGGELRVESELGSGSRFWFDVPLGVAPDAVAITFSEDGSGPVGGLEGTVLVVEDDATVRAVVTALVESLGCRVVAAESGAAALERLDDGEVDVVLMDCQMPGMDGFETTQRLRRRRGFSDLPVIALTAAVYEKDRERCRAAGMDDFLSKPCTQRDLEGVLRRWLGSPRVSSARLP